MKRGPIPKNPLAIQDENGQLDIEIKRAFLDGRVYLGADWRGAREDPHRELAGFYVVVLQEDEDPDPETQEQ